MPGALEGIKVLDFSWGIAGPMAGMLLCDNSAQVIKIEPPGGDPFRGLPGYPIWNRGKESLILDLKAPQGRETAQKLAQDADVLLESFAPGVTSRLGIDYPSLSRVNPRLVYCSISAYGDQGPWRDEPGYDILVAARSGILGAQPGFRPGPVHMVAPIPSLGAALLAAQGVAVALMVREATGRGQRVEASLFNGALAMQASEFVFAPSLPSPMSRGARSPLGSSPFYSLYQCQDGRWLHLGCINLGLVWKAVRALGLEETMLDPKFGDGRNFPSDEGRQELISILREKISQRPYHQWDKIFDEADVPYAPADTTEAFMEDPQVSFSQMVVELDDPVLGPMKQMGLPLKFGGTPGQIKGPAPAPGQHSEDTLAQWASVVSDKGRDVREATSSIAQPSSNDRVKKHPLDGVKVLDLSSYLAGPVCPKLMAELGAEVIKLESLDGDGLRGLTAGFLGWNRGKRCIAVDLKQPEGLEIAYKLAAQSDVVVENMRPGVAERLGLGYEKLREINPQVIYCSVPAYGSQGPYVHKPGVDPLLQARSGVEQAQGGHGNPPVFLRVPICDYATAMLAAVGVSMALYARAKMGQGQRIETSLLNVGTLVNSEAFTQYAGRPPRRINEKGQWGFGHLYRIYQTKDGWLFLAASRGQWEGLCRAMDVESLPLPASGDSWLVSSRPAGSGQALRPGSGQAPLAAFLEKVFREKDTEEWLFRLKGEGIPCAPVSETYHRDFFTDPHALANDLVAVHNHPVLGEVKQTGILVKFSETPGRLQGPAPLLGEHTQEILGEMGYALEEAQRLKEKRVVAWGERH